MDRKQKLAKLQKSKAKAKPETKADFALLVDGLEGSIRDFTKALGLGVHIKNVDDLIAQLADMEVFRDAIMALKGAIDEMPKEVEIKGVDGFLAAVQAIKIDPSFTIKETDYTPVIQKLIDMFAEVNKTIEDNKYKPSQKAEDYIPHRRVVKKGNIFVYDDTPTPANAGGVGHGTGGSGAVPTINGSVPVVNPDGSPIAGGSSGGLTDTELRSSPVDVSVESESLVKKTVTASSSGNTTIHTPASGKKIRLYFFGYSAGSDITGNLVGLKLTGYNGDAVFDNQYLIAPGQPYARNIQGGKRYIEGSVNGALVVNLSAAETVYVNYELEEI